MSTGRKRAWTADDRRVRVMLALHRAEVPLRLIEVIDAAGYATASNRKSVTVRMLKYLRECEQALYCPPAPGETHLGGTYELTEDGRAWLLSHGFLSKDEIEDEPPIVTGAMRAETPTQLESRAVDGQAPAGAIASVFQLGQLCMEAAA